jgi:carboxylate-amine ligase
MLDRFGLTGREQLTCGCHVRVSVGEDEEPVGSVWRASSPWLERQRRRAHRI